MKYINIINTSTIVNNMLKSFVKEGFKVLDCTVGNGNDTLLLAELVGQAGIVYGFDIQDIAIENTKNKLKDEGYLDRVFLIKDSHEKLSKYINEKLDLIIYNLGYLPKGDKNLKTHADSSLNSLKEALELIKNNGLILITVYTGHEGGTEEKEVIENLLKSLNQKEYNVLKYDFLNQMNDPPILYIIEKSSHI